MRSLMAILLLILLRSTANAEQAVVASSMRTSDVIESCRRAGSTPMRMDCAGYILGIYDQLSLSRLICPPNNPAGGSSQAVAVALKFLNDHPERWHIGPAFLVGESFRAAFPCPKSSD